MGEVVVDKDSYTEKCIIAMASLTEVKFRKRKGSYRDGGPNDTIALVPGEEPLRLGAERGTVCRLTHA